MAARTSKPNHRESAGTPRESPRSIAATVGWMLSTLTTLVAMLAVGGLMIAARFVTRGDVLMMLSRLLLFAAAVSGLAALVLLAVTWVVREDRPPTAIVVGSIVITAIPLIGVVLAMV